MSAFAAPERHTSPVYDQPRGGHSLRVFYIVKCPTCNIGLNSGHHYSERALPFAQRLADEHNATEHAAARVETRHCFHCGWSGATETIEAACEAGTDQPVHPDCWSEHALDCVDCGDGPDTGKLD